MKLESPSKSGGLIDASDSVSAEARTEARTSTDPGQSRSATEGMGSVEVSLSRLPTPQQVAILEVLASGGQCFNTYGPPPYPASTVAVMLGLDISNTARQLRQALSIA
jgi:hypothetical protein